MRKNVVAAKNRRLSKKEVDQASKLAHEIHAAHQNSAREIIDQMSKDGRLLAQTGYVGRLSQSLQKAESAATDLLKRDSGLTQIQAQALLADSSKNHDRQFRALANAISRKITDLAALDTTYKILLKANKTSTIVLTNKIINANLAPGGDDINRDIDRVTDTVW